MTVTSIIDQIHIIEYAPSCRCCAQDRGGRMADGSVVLISLTILAKGSMSPCGLHLKKSGRGLTALETPDYEISTEVDDHDLVFGSSYKVRYRIKNTSASELAVEIKAHYTRVSYRGTIAPMYPFIVSCISYRYTTVGR